MIDNLFLSVGAMKAGTTWLYEQFKNHQDIYFTPEKEIHYFANKVGIESQLNHKNRIIKLKSILEVVCKGNPKYISENLEKISWYAEYARNKDISNEWYESLFRFNHEKRYCADFSNLYCQMGPEGWKNVRKIARNVKVIYTLRDPLDRLWSHYKFHMKWIGRENEVINDGFEIFKTTLNYNFFWVNTEYSRNYNMLKKSLNDNEIMILYFEDFRTKPIEMLHEIHDFLNIRKVIPESFKLDEKVNSTKVISLPDEWREYAMLRLKKEYNSAKELNLWHHKWIL
ncbi:sulfotransferase [Grimontia hollisae]|uniref:sulfotransferase n=1 Tax=Grimontia hollisae TaxID=673 RepID=UPI0013037627|nr:sulfotransferase [Grimontia hollisae]